MTSPISLQSTSLVFSIPQFRALTEAEKQNERLTEIEVDIIVAVDGRRSDESTQFVYSKQFIYTQNKATLYPGQGIVLTVR